MGDKELNHQCSKIEELATMRERLRAVIDAIKEHHKSLYGNGRKGLDDRMNDAEGRIDTVEKTLAAKIDGEEKEKNEMRSLRNQIVVGIVLIVIASWIGGSVTGCTRVSFSESRPDGTEVHGAYTYILQDKSLDLGYDPTNGTHIKANNSSDPAVEAFKEGLASGAAKAVAP